jgi:hypothetical protein
MQLARRRPARTVLFSSSRRSGARERRDPESQVHLDFDGERQ